jgi:hypothetical protein
MTPAAVLSQTDSLPSHRETMAAQETDVMTNLPLHPAFDQVRGAAAKLQTEIANGPIVPFTAPEEIREYLASRYDFSKPMALDDVIGDVQQMLRKWQVHVTHPRYFGLFNPSVTVA